MSSQAQRILSKQDDLAAFRAEIRAWLKEVLPPAEELEAKADLCGRDYAGFEAFQKWWMAELNKVGLATPHWPVEFGGAALSLKHTAVIADEMARASAPRRNMYVISLNHIPATVGKWGSAYQKERYLPGVAKGEAWCQGFSEPGAGSDLASLRTKAEKVGNEYVINGQKIWSSMSKHARYCILLARTDFNVKKHGGISYFLLDMKSPGVEVRPIRQATDRGEFSELFLTDVKIPEKELIGGENKGWAVAQTTLASERGVIAFEETERARYEMEGFLNRAIVENAEWLNDDGLRRECVRHIGTLQALRRLIRELLENNEKHPEAPSVHPSTIKITATQLEQDFYNLLTRIKGIEGQVFQPEDAAMGDVPGNPLHEYLRSFGGTIAGGTNEIQRNIIAERGLGMPRER